MIRQPIVVGFDDSPASRQALAWAMHTARGRQSDVLLVHAAMTFPPILPGHGDYVAPPREIAVEAGNAVLQAGSLLAADLAPEVTVTTLLLEEPPAMALLSMLDSAEMAVVGSRGLGGFSELMVGSTSLKLATHATCPVVVVSARPLVGEPGPTAGRVVVGLDIDEPGVDGILAFAFEEAAWRNVGLTAVHAWQERFYDLPGKGGLVPRRVQLEEFQVDQRRRLSEAVAAWQGKYPDVDVRVDVVPQSPAWTLVAATAGAELIVVGNRGRGRVRSQLLGSVSHALLHHAQCPVAVIRTHG